MLGCTFAIGILGVAATVLAQGTFEPADFNVTDALLSQGVNVSAIPALEGLVERSSTSACSIAVCFNSTSTHPTLLRQTSDPIRFGDLV